MWGAAYAQGVSKCVRARVQALACVDVQGRLLHSLEDPVPRYQTPLL